MPAAGSKTKPSSARRRPPAKSSLEERAVEEMRRLTERAEKAAAAAVESRQVSQQWAISNANPNPVPTFDFTDGVEMASPAAPVHTHLDHLANQIEEIHGQLTALESRLQHVLPEKCGEDPKVLAAERLGGSPIAMRLHEHAHHLHQAIERLVHLNANLEI